MDNSTTTWIMVAVLLLLIGAAIFMLLRRPGGGDPAVDSRDAAAAEGRDAALDRPADARTADLDGDGVPDADGATRGRADAVYDQTAHDGVDHGQDRGREAASIGAMGAAGAGAAGTGATDADAVAADGQAGYGEHEGTYEQTSDQAYVADDTPAEEAYVADQSDTDEDQGRWREAASIGAMGAAAGAGATGAAADAQPEEDYAADQQGVQPLTTEQVDAGASEDPLAVEDQTPADEDEIAAEADRHGSDTPHDAVAGHDASHDAVADHEAGADHDADTYAGADAGADERQDHASGWGTAAAAGATGAAAGAAGATAAGRSEDHDTPVFQDSHHEDSHHDGADLPETRGYEDSQGFDTRASEEEYPVGDSTYRADEGQALEVKETGADGRAPGDEGYLGEPASEGYTAAPASEGYTAAPASPEAYREDTTTGDSYRDDIRPGEPYQDAGHVDQGAPVVEESDYRDEPGYRDDRADYATQDYDVDRGSDEGYAPVDQPVTDGTDDTARLDTTGADRALEHRADGTDGTVTDAAGSGAAAGGSVFAESIYGAGSAEPLEDGSGPPGWELKGNAGSMLFHTPDSPSYDAVRTEVWFESEEAARAAGFAHWDRRRR